MNEITVFNNNQFGDIRTVTIDGEPWFVAADVCRALELTDTGKATGRLDEDELTRIKIESGGQGREVIAVNESGLYSLVLGSRKPEAKTFKRWITHEVIPSIRKTGSYAVALSPAELLVKQAQMLLEQERRMTAVEKDLSELKAHIETHPTGYYTISGYASLRGIRVDASLANMLGRKAVKLSNEYGYDIGKASDAKYGTVNTYHEDILKEVFDVYRRDRS